MVPFVIAGVLHAAEGFRAGGCQHDTPRAHPGPICATVARAHVTRVRVWAGEAHCDGDWKRPDKSFGKGWVEHKLGLKVPYFPCFVFLWFSGRFQRFPSKKWTKTFEFACLGFSSPPSPSLTGVQGVGGCITNSQTPPLAALEGYPGHSTRALNRPLGGNWPSSSSYCVPAIAGVPHLRGNFEGKA